MSELDDLATEATQMGIVDKDQVCVYLESYIKNTQSYLAYRKRKGRETSHDHMSSLYALAAARAIYLLQHEEGEQE